MVFLVTSRQGKSENRKAPGETGHVANSTQGWATLISQAIPIVSTIMEDLSHSHRTEDHGVKTLKKALLASMEKRFACYEDNEVYTLATKVSTVENTLEVLKDKLYEEVSQPSEDINSSSSSSNSDTSDTFAAKMKAMIKKNKTKSGPDGKD